VDVGILCTKYNLRKFRYVYVCVENLTTLLVVTRKQRRTGSKPITINVMGQKSSTIDNNNLDEGASSRYSRRRTAQEDSSSRPSRVRFSEKLKIVLIPSRTEFNAFRLTETLWWSNQEFLVIKISRINATAIK
jgi:hypothetical protein